jgi:hypothetical protein
MRRGCTAESTANAGSRSSVVTPGADVWLYCAVILPLSITFFHRADSSAW